MNGNSHVWFGRDKSPRCAGTIASAESVLPQRRVLPGDQICSFVAQRNILVTWVRATPKSNGDVFCHIILRRLVTLSVGGARSNLV